MRANDFKILKKNCDNILLNNLNNITISNNSLNIIKGHPFHVTIYKKNFLKKTSNLVLYILKNIIYFFLATINSYSLEKINKKKVDVILITSLLNINHLNKKDYIFFDLEDKLKKEKISYHKIFINHTNYSKKKILNRLKNNKNTSVLEFNFSNFLSSIVILIYQIKYFLLFYFYSMKEKNKNKKNLFMILAIEFLNMGTKKNLNLLYNFRKILNQINFDKLIIPYEGYSWERLLIKETKKKNKKIKCLGYHFSAISQHQHSIFRKVNFNYEPDVIYTTGNFVKNKFQKMTNHKVKIIGTSRFFQKKKKYIQKRNKIFLYNCLVLPEGIKSECKKLFQFSFVAAKKFKNIKFIWRLHPTMNFEKLLPNVGLSKNNMPNNIILSEKSFFKDIDEANICLYRGSTSAITALQKGILPIYLDEPESLNIDPLFELNKWKKSIKNLNDYEKIINFKFKNLKSNYNDKKFAINFSLKYFEKLDNQLIIDDLKK
jgi:hypothetical protein